MADKAPLIAVPKPLLEEALRRLSAARSEKAAFLTDFIEAFQFCMPWRVKPGQTTSATRTNTESQNFTSLGPMMTSDFASDIADTFAPEHTDWAKEEISASVLAQFEAGANVGDVDDLKAKVDLDCKIVLDAIGASNFYETFKQGAKDLSISAFAMIIEDPGKGAAIRCQVVPIPELQMLRAPTGGIGVRAWEQKLTVQDIEELFPDKTLPKKVLEKRGRKQASVTKTQIAWRDYASPGVLAWHMMALLDDEPLEYSHHEGDGSCSIIPCRWDPDAPFAWGTGPAIVALPEYRSLDEVEYLSLKGLARVIDPPIAYDDDGVINLEGGLANGVMIPRLEGSKLDVIESQHPNSMSDGEAKAQKLEHKIRRHYYLDEPQQEGLTPPTLGQWMDESMRRQRRLGTPAAAIWTEFLSEVFLRFRYLMVKRGDLKPVTFKGQAIVLRPVNPLKRAAEMEEAAASLRTLQSIASLFGPQILPEVLVVGATIHKIVQQAQATGLTLKREADIDKALADAAQMAKVGAAAAAAGQSGLVPPLLAATQKGVIPQ